MVLSCCVPGCRNRSKEFSFHRLPKNEAERKKWIFAITRHHPSKPLILKYFSRVCGKHFRPDNYRFAGNVKQLRKGSVPSVFHGSVNEEENKDSIKPNYQNSIVTSETKAIKTEVKEEVCEEELLDSFGVESYKREASPELDVKVEYLEFELAVVKEEHY